MDVRSVVPQRTQASVASASRVVTVLSIGLGIPAGYPELAERKSPPDAGLQRYREASH
jgi:hypothetical protein